MAEEIDWNLCTFEGLRLQQHREFLALTFREKMERLEGMNEVAKLFRDQRCRDGLPYRDPQTNEIVPGTRAAEQPGEYRA